jgi:hypothetical protein
VGPTDRDPSAPPVPTILAPITTIFPAVQAILPPIAYATVVQCIAAVFATVETVFAPVSSILGPIPARAGAGKRWGDRNRRRHESNQQGLREAGHAVLRNRVSGAQCL